MCSRIVQVFINSCVVTVCHQSQLKWRLHCLYVHWLPLPRNLSWSFVRGTFSEFSNGKDLSVASQDAYDVDLWGPDGCLPSCLSEVWKGWEWQQVTSDMCVFANNPIGAFVAGRIVWDRTCRSFGLEVRSAKHVFLTTLSFTLSSSFLSYVRKGRCCWCSHHGLHQRYAEWVWLHFQDCGFRLALCIGQEGTSWALLILLVWNVKAWCFIQIQSFWLKGCHMTDDVAWHRLVVKWGLLCNWAAC